MLFLKSRLDYYNVKYHQNQSNTNAKSNVIVNINSNANSNEENIEEYEISLTGMLNKIQFKRNN